ncbi:MAG TPA: hypothetical protein VEC57_16400 [Candidatus Limnocylindrales bacterium]|nr:hypothetical protein [Candidatus Limnocylindrales bacterium]
MMGPTAREHAGHLRGAAAVLVVMAAAAACAPQKTATVTGPPPAISGSKLSLARVDADFRVQGDAREILNEALRDSIAAAKLSCTAGTAGCATLDVRATLRAPAPAFRHASAGMPIRVVELVSSVRDGAGAGSMVHQRTVAVTGDMSTATWMRVADQLATDLVRELSIRSRGDSAVISLPSWAAHDARLERVSAPQAFHVPVVSDTRADTARVGVMTSRDGKAFPIRMTRRPTDYLTEAIGDELRAVGHVIVPAMDGRLVGTELETFWIDASQTSTGWNVTARIEVDFEVAPPAGAKRRKPERHACSKTMKLGGTPSEADLARVLEACFVDLMASMRNDPVWAGS